MGRHYLGPGASIANSMVFGYIAARHATVGRGDVTASDQVDAVPPDGDRLRRALPRGGDDSLLGRPGGIDDEGHLVVVEVERAGRPEDAVPRAHAPIRVDLDVEGHRPIVGRSPRDGGRR